MSLAIIILEYAHVIRKETLNFNLKDNLVIQYYKVVVKMNCIAKSPRWA